MEVQLPVFVLSSLVFGLVVGFVSGLIVTLLASS